jgi:hypothetical protein
MGASASLQTTELTVVPGGEAQAELRVRNTGTVVDQFTFSPIGTAQGWITVEPPQVSLFPGAEETVRVLFRPPRAHTTPAGPSPFAIKVNSREDPEGSVVEEGVVTVEPFDDRTGELIPRTSSGSRSGKHDIAIDNRGNARASLSLSAIDPDQLLSFAIEPAALSIDPGTAQFAKLKVVPRKKFWRGTPVTKPFQIVAEEEGKEPIVLDGSFLQKPMLPKWFWKALLALLVLLLLLFLLWQLVLKPEINSQSKKAAQEEVAPVEDRLNAAGIPTLPPAVEEQQEQTPGTTVVPPPGAGATTVPGQTTIPGATTIPGTTAPPPSGTTELGDPIDLRLVASAPLSGQPGDPAPGTFPIPDGRTFSLTDIVLQNPNGDSGRLTILRGSEVLLESGLENFRDLDYHFVAPYVFESGENLTLSITCTAVGQAGGTTCNAAATFSGFIR